MFKLILGLGVNDIESLKEISLFYAKSGADMIDCSVDSILPLQKYLKEQNIDLNKIKFCVSVALSGDVHTKKAKINKNCTNCKKCLSICSQNAIEAKDDKIRINFLKCSGCSFCREICKNGAVDIYELNNIEDSLETIKNDEIKLDLLEVHLSIKKKKKILSGFEEICKKYKGNISICISRKYFGSSKVINIIEKLKTIFYKYNPSFSLTIQADGSSVNNANEGYASNLEALAFYSELMKQNYNVVLSGGLNSKTIELLKLFNLKPEGLAFGTYARKLALEDKQKAQELIDSVKEFYSR